jgi:hypothetical protein
MTRIRWAVHGSDAYKSLEEDSIFQPLLQEFLQIVVSPMLKIYKACLSL